MLTACSHRCTSTPHTLHVHILWTVYECLFVYCLSIVYLILQLHAVTQIKIIVITTTISADHSDHYPALMTTISADQLMAMLQEGPAPATGHTNVRARTTRLFTTVHVQNVQNHKLLTFWQHYCWQCSSAWHSTGWWKPKMVVAIIVYDLSVVGRVDGKVDHFILNKQSIVFIILEVNL